MVFLLYSVIVMNNTDFSLLINCFPGISLSDHYIVSFVYIVGFYLFIFVKNFTFLFMGDFGL